jgi:hypothetical protein
MRLQHLLQADNPRTSPTLISPSPPIVPPSGQSSPFPSFYYPAYSFPSMIPIPSTFFMGTCLLIHISLHSPPFPSPLLPLPLPFQVDHEVVHHIPSISTTPSCPYLIPSLPLPLPPPHSLLHKRPVPPFPSNHSVIFPFLSYPLLSMQQLVPFFPPNSP